MRRATVLFSFILVSTTLLTGCPSASSPVPVQEEAWVVKLKKRAAKVQSRFFASNFIQNKTDPFYLDEVTPRLKVGVALTSGQRAKIENLKADFEESWPLLLAHVQRSQLAMAAVAAVPALRVNTSLSAKAPEGKEHEIVDLFGRLQRVVEENVLFEDSSRFRTRELLDEIALKTLWRADSRQGKSKEPAGLQDLEIESGCEAIRVLNPVAASRLDPSYDKELAPEPTRLWASLVLVYERIFEAMLDPAGPRVDEVLVLRQDERGMLIQLVAITEKQFEMFTKIVGSSVAR